MALDALLETVSHGHDGAVAETRWPQDGIRLLSLLVDKARADAVFRAEPELVALAVGNPVYVAQLKVFRTDMYRALLEKAGETFRADKEISALIAAAASALSDEPNFTAEGGKRLTRAEELAQKLNEAGRNGRTEAVRLLLEEGADPNLRDTTETTALIEAGRNGHTEAMRLLLDEGADPNLRDTTETTTALIEVAWFGHTEAVRMLLDKGADPNLRNHIGATALMWAAWNGHTDVVTMLLDKDADFNLFDKEGCTALLGAAGNGHTEAVRLLLEKGADPRIRSRDGRTPMMKATANGHWEIRQMLSVSEQARRSHSEAPR